jgi:hypothetical protein
MTSARGPRHHGPAPANKPPAPAQEINGEDDDASLEVDDMEEWLETHALMMAEITACGTTAGVIAHHIIVRPAAPRRAASDPTAQPPDRSTARAHKRSSMQSGWPPALTAPCARSTSWGATT